MTWTTRWYIWIAAMLMTTAGGCLAWWQYWKLTSLVHEVASLRALYHMFPHVVYNETNDTCEEEDVSFLTLNRDTTYLLQEAKTFLQRNRPQPRRMMVPNKRSSSQQNTKRHKKQVPAREQLQLPIPHGQFWISSLFGPRKRASGAMGYHYGVDLAAPRGTPVFACASGKVVQAGWNGGFGNMIVIAHDEGMRTRYAHLSAIHVTSGAYVAQGAKIGAVGDTGHVRKNGRDASHLHLEVERYGKREDPLMYLKME